MKLNRKIWNDTIKKIVKLIFNVENEYLESYVWGEMHRAKTMKDFRDKMSIWIEEV